MTKIIITDNQPVFVSGTDTVAALEGLKEFRRQYQLTAKDLADICGCSDRTVDNWFTGRPIEEVHLHRLYHYQQGLSVDKNRTMFFGRR